MNSRKWIPGNELGCLTMNSTTRYLTHSLNFVAEMPLTSSLSTSSQIGDLQDAIRKFNANIDELSKLHSSQIDSVDVGGSNLTRQIDGLIEETRGLMGNIKKRIQSLQSQRVDARAANMRRPQLELIRSKFMDAIQKYQTEEKAYRDKTKDRIARQYMIGK